MQPVLVAVMPEGVEHINPLTGRASRTWVLVAVMPEGVEHPSFSVVISDEDASSWR